MVKIGNIALGDFPLLLAPMEDVSDPPFRVLCRENGADMVYTEFISSEGLIRGAGKSVQKLDIYEEERPVGIQIFGDKIESMREAARIAEQAEPELIDINYGCPVKNVACRGAGAALLQDLPKMQAMTKEIIDTVKLPVTVKTRLGWDVNTINVIEAIMRLQDTGVQAVTIHARTRVQMYKGEADWTWLKRIKEDKNIFIPVFGNGDIDSPEKALKMKEYSGVDGIMIGRAAIGYPWIFREIKHFLRTSTHFTPPVLEERVNACRRHLQKSIEWKGEKLGILEMRKHYGNYFKGLPFMKEYRMRLVQSMDPAELFAVLDEVKESVLTLTLNT